MNNCDLVQKALLDILSKETVTLDFVKQYFSEKYIQVVDGKTIDFNDFFNHLITLKKLTKNISIKIKSIASNEHFVHTYHIARATKEDDSISEFQVFACFQIENGKIIHCEELTRMIIGSKHDDDLGSKI